jgi:hypothetical protein
MSLLNSLDNKIKTAVKKEVQQNTILKLKDIPVVFLSYDEPNADENFQYLLDNHPNAEKVYRVHGVKGFDAAHKEAGRIANSPRFFTVDADCKIDKSIWTKSVELTPDIAEATLSWSSRNVVNGLVYGNGGVKLWYTKHVMNMKSHEAADPEDGTNNVDFCWDPENYKQMNNTYGVVHNNSSPKQAFRAGFREGIKMGLDQGNKVPLHDFKHKMYPANYARWLIWMTVGRDIENGAWVIYGARLAAYKLYVENFDHTVIADYDWFHKFWEQQSQILEHGEYLESHNRKLLTDLRDSLGLPLAELDAEQSIWFKHVHISPGKGLGWPALLNQSALPLYGFTLPKY